MQQRQPFPRRPLQRYLWSMCQVSLQSILILQIFLPSQVAFVVVLNFHEPRFAWHLLDTLANLSVLKDLSYAAETTEHIHARVRRILKDAQDTAVREMVPNQFAIPKAAISTLSELQPFLCKLLSDAVGASHLTKGAKDQPYSTLYFRIWVQNNLAIVTPR